MNVRSEVWYHVLFSLQTEVITLAEEACEDIAGPYASMVGVLLWKSP